MLVVAVQALAADCELRCSTMTAMSRHCDGPVKSGTSSAQAAHCHGVSMESNKGSLTVATREECQVSVCKFASDAITKRLGVDELTSQVSPIISSGQSSLHLTACGAPQFANFRSRIRRELGAPLDLRPGSSLRI